jgi:hypothetical protein
MKASSTLSCRHVRMVDQMVDWKVSWLHSWLDGSVDAWCVGWSVHGLLVAICKKQLVRGKQETAWHVLEVDLTLPPKPLRSLLQGFKQALLVDAQHKSRHGGWDRAGRHVRELQAGLGSML